MESKEEIISKCKILLDAYRSGKLGYMKMPEDSSPDFSDEIPSKIIHSPDKDNKYKVRAAWWSSVSFNIHGLDKHGLIPKEYVDEYNKIMELHQKNLNELIRAESIEAVNELIRKVINYLEN